MERFENAQVGDLVYNRMYGDAVIKQTNRDHSVYKIAAFCINKMSNEVFTVGGYNTDNDSEPTWFYRKGEERYLTERPEPEADWSTVAPGTLCIVKDFEEDSERERKFLCFADGEMWFKQLNGCHANKWNYARIK